MEKIAVTARAIEWSTAVVGVDENEWMVQQVEEVSRLSHLPRKSESWPTVNDEILILVELYSMQLKIFEVLAEGAACIR
jgi:hypothetical protein